MKRGQPFYKNKVFLIIISTLIFIGLLTSFRILWGNAFKNHISLSSKNGQLDLSERTFNDDRVYALEGEWDFYANQLITKENLNSEALAPSSILVPGAWNDNLSNNEPTPYGYGTYHLKIKVDPDLHKQYAVNFSSIRSASAVYINDVLYHENGEVGESEKETVARNVPFTVTFKPDQAGNIDLFVQVANYAYNGQSGIIRSVEFGTEQAISTYINASIVMQLLVIILFLTLGTFSLFIYIFTDRNRRLVYFTMMTFSFVGTTALSSGDKVFNLLFSTTYLWEFRLTNIFLITTFYALMFCTRYYYTKLWRGSYITLSVIYLLTITGILFMDTNQIVASKVPFGIFITLMMIVTQVSVISHIFKGFKNNILLMFSLITFSHHLVWTANWRDYTNIIYYPFDLIISISLFAALFLKKYYDDLHRTELYANKLEEINDHRNKFLITTANELKSPLNAIVNLIEKGLKNDQQSLSSSMRADMSSSLQVGYRLLRIIDDIKDSLNLEKYNPKIQQKVVYVQPILRSVIDMLSLHISQSQINLKIHLDEKTPPIFADENRMIQIFYNILFQSIKNASDSKITIGAVEKETYLQIGINVQGLYLSNGTISRIEQNFEEQYNQSLIFERELEIGLRIVKNLILLQDGQFKITSKKKLTTFYLRLPLATEHVELIDPEPLVMDLHADYETEAKSIPLDIDETTKPTIMIVETAAYHSLKIASMLSNNTYAYHTVYSGQSCLETLQEMNVDLLIVNHILKDMSGYQLIETIREAYTYNDLPILLITTNANTEEMLAGFKYGANDYITRPILSEELNARVRTLLTIKQSVDEQLKLEASWLQAQIKPHFIFNVINSIIALSEVDVEKMRLMLEDFSDLLKYKFKFYNTSRRTSIREELSITQKYLDIEKIRFGDRLEIDLDVDETSLNVALPFLTIEPLVENAIEHGLMKSVQGGKVSLYIKNYDNHIQVVVEDNGVGMSEAKVQALLSEDRRQEGIGIINTHLRLKKYYGQGLTVESKLNKGTKISFTIPK